MLSQDSGTLKPIARIALSSGCRPVDNLLLAVRFSASLSLGPGTGHGIQRVSIVGTKQRYSTCYHGCGWQSLGMMRSQLEFGDPRYWLLINDTTGLPVLASFQALVMSCKRKPKHYLKRDSFV